MEEVPAVSVDFNSRIRDLEEKQQLLKDRVLLIGKSLIDDRQQIMQSVQDMRKTVTMLKAENDRIKEVIRNITEQMEKTARREELSSVQRQLDLLRR